MLSQIEDKAKETQENLSSLSQQSQEFESEADSLE